MRASGSARALLAIVLVACGGRREPHEDHPRRAAAEPAARAAEGADDLLRIDPGMLRDLRITTSAVEARPGGEGVTALGEVGVDEERYAEVGSPITARVSEVLAKVGDTVAAGEPLAVLESVELGRARGALTAARARAQLARRTLARKRGLAAERIVPRREVQEAEAAEAAAEAEREAAEAALRALGVSPDEAATGAGETARLQLRSPVAGVVIDRAVVRGEVVDPTRRLFQVADLARLWLTVHAFERDAVRLSAGAPARVTLAALPGRSFAGTATLVGRRVDPGSRTIPVRIELSNEDGALRPGMSASAWLPLGEGGEGVVAVPAASLQRLHDGWCAFLPRGEGAFEVRRVGRGRDLGGAVEIVAGLRPGETVVVEGAFLLKAEAEKARGEGERHEH
jgi:cobalt-zinc-cadmium efflux system membrane fusion protein